MKKVLIIITLSIALFPAAATNSPALIRIDNSHIIPAHPGSISSLMIVTEGELVTPQIELNHEFYFREDNIWGRRRHPDHAACVSIKDE